MNSWEVASASPGGGSQQVQSPRTEVTLLLSGHSHWQSDCQGLSWGRGSRKGCCEHTDCSISTAPGDFWMGIPHAASLI